MYLIFPESVPELRIASLGGISGKSNVTISDADKYLSAMESFTFRWSSVYYSICLYINGLIPLAGGQFNPTPNEYEIQFPFTEPELMRI
jgi:hypothetical protein